MASQDGVSESGVSGDDAAASPEITVADADLDVDAQVGHGSDGDGVLSQQSTPAASPESLGHDDHHHFFSPVEAAMAPYSELTSRLAIKLCENDPKNDSATFSSCPDTIKDFEDLFGFMLHVFSSRCLACNQMHLDYENSPEEHAGLAEDWIFGDTLKLSSKLQCRECAMKSCPFCDSRDDVRIMLRETTSWIKVRGKTVEWCCTAGRVLLILLLLCASDRRREPATEARKRASSPQLSDKMREETKKQTTETETSGVGYEPMPEDEDDDNFWTPEDLKAAARQMRARQIEMFRDASGSLLLRVLAALLPKMSRKSTFDQEPPPLLEELLLESDFLDYSDSLLRNGSLEDMVNRHLLYENLFLFIETLSSHDCTRGLVYRDRLVRRQGLDPSLLFYLPSLGLSGTRKDNSRPMFELFCALAEQSSLFTRQYEDYANDKDCLMRLVRRIEALSKFLSHNGSGYSNAATIRATTLEQGPKKTTDADYDQILAGYYWAEEVNSLKDVVKGRMKKILLEISILESSLPAGIYVRYADHRPDIMKVVIIGPVGTPYENGIFEFDVKFPDDYPKSPPIVRFKTTGGGLVAFNPNLYPDGKVCLSLLNTWPGEPWRRDESTLLQVLVSIQAMVFCEEPWYNEPGSPLDESDKLSTCFNAVLKQHTVTFAILEWANNPPVLWADVVAHHFKKNGDQILRNMQSWIQERIKLSADKYTCYFRSVGRIHGASLFANQRKLQTAMQKYGSTWDLPVVYAPAAPSSRRKKHKKKPLPPAAPPAASTMEPLSEDPLMDASVSEVDLGALTKSTATQGQETQPAAIPSQQQKKISLPATAEELLAAKSDLGGVKKSTATQGQDEQSSQLLNLLRFNGGSTESTVAQGKGHPSFDPKKTNIPGGRYGHAMYIQAYGPAQILSPSLHPAPGLVQPPLPPAGHGHTGRGGSYHLASYSSNAQGPIRGVFGRGRGGPYHSLHPALLRGGRGGIYHNPLPPAACGPTGRGRVYHSPHPPSYARGSVRGGYGRGRGEGVASGPVTGSVAGSESDSRGGRATSRGRLLRGNRGRGHGAG